MFLPTSFTPLWAAPDPSPPGGLWFVFEGGSLLTSIASGEAEAVTVPRGDRWPVPIDGVVCIGLLGEVPCWAARVRTKAVLAGFELAPLRRLFDHLRYFGSECWPFPHSLMVAFLAEYAGGEIHCQKGEIVDAQWFPVDCLPALPHRLSVARRLIDHAATQAAR
ncbi:MAG: NUDIX-like domain-containing protein [Bacteroidales bacterium]